MLEDTPHPQGIAFLWRLDLDDFSTKIGQDTARKRPGDELAKFEDTHPVEGRAGMVVDEAIGPSDLLQCHEDAVADTFIDSMLRCPLPVVSSTRSTSPAPMTRDSPSLAVICTPLSRLMMYCRRGAGCQSRS
jgi:hypothetical protein